MGRNEEMELGKIEANGTRWCVRRGLHVGWRGTRREGAGAAKIAKSRISAVHPRAVRTVARPVAMGGGYGGI